MRRGLHRGLNLPVPLPLLLLLPAICQSAVHFRNIYREKTTTSTSSTLSNLFPVTGDGGRLVCLLTVTSDLLTITHSQVECDSLDQTKNLTDSEIISNSWTFYDKIGDSVYSVEASITLMPSTDSILQLTLCLRPVSCGGVSTTSCLSYPSTVTSSISLHSSSPEGFVFAIAGPSSSSFTQETTTITPPETQPVEAEVSSASVPSYVSSYPEGFVMAFTAEESSSISAHSSEAEGFVFAFNNHQDSSSH